MTDEFLSKTEDMRLVRALYCFQLNCNLLGISRYHSVWDRSRWDFDDDSDIFKLFLCIYESWEIEGIACIYKFAEEELDRIFSDIYHDVHPTNPKVEHYPPTTTGAFDFDSECQSCIPSPFLFLHTDH